MAAKEAHKAAVISERANAKAAYREKKHKEYVKAYNVKQASKPENIAKRMTDEELNTAINRKRKEQEYVKLMTSDTSLLKDHGDAFLAGTLATFGTVTVTTLATKGGQAAAAAFLDKVLDPKIFKAIYKK